MPGATPAQAREIVAFDVSPAGEQLAVVARVGSGGPPTDGSGADTDARSALYILPVGTDEPLRFAPVAVFGPGAPVTIVAFSPDGRRLAHDGEVLTVRDLDSDTVTTLDSLVLPSGAPGLTWSADGRRLAFGSPVERDACCGHTTTVGVGADGGLVVVVAAAQIDGGYPWFDATGAVHTVVPSPDGRPSPYLPADTAPAADVVLAVALPDAAGAARLAWWPTGDLDRATDLGVLPAGLRAPRW